MVENWAHVGNQNGVKSTDFSEDSPILATDLEFGFAVETNAEFEPAGEVIEFGQRTTFKNASSLGFETFYRFPSRTGRLEIMKSHPSSISPPITVYRLGIWGRRGNA